MGELRILVFEMLGQRWGIDVGYVKEVVRLRQFTKVPNAPGSIVGVFNLRGQIVPLIDLGVVLGLGSSERNYVVVIEADEELLGVVIGGVQGVVTVPKDSIEPPPPDTSDKIRGVARVQDSLVSILDVEKIVSALRSGELG